MLEFHETNPYPNQDTSEAVSIQLLLFLDDRPTSQKYIRQVMSNLEQIAQDVPYTLKIMEIGEHPHLVEHFRLIVTPALIKIFPEPRETLAGSNIVYGLERCWPRWQESLKQQMSQGSNGEGTSGVMSNSLSYSAELMQASDDIFRLKKEKEALLEQLRFKDQIIHMLAHDLRSPLTAASIAVDTLEITDTQKRSERVHQIKKNIYQQTKTNFQTMNRMITDLLDASRTMNGQFTLTYSEISLKDLSKGILAQLYEQSKAKSLKITHDIPQDLPYLYADEELIRKVIVNILENAIKYTPEQGSITLSILHKTRQKVQVSISDTGLGIPEEKQEQIFEGHFRLQRDQTKEGYGLGLALCRKIILAHYGRIWVDSVPGKGSCFHFTLPICD
ncbi:MAG: histidine kinase [Microcystaceae cyanobacterium]